MSTNTEDSPVGYTRTTIFDPTNRRIVFLDPVDGGILPIIELEKSMVHREAFFTASIKEKVSHGNKKHLYLKTPNGKTEIHISRKSNISVTDATSVNFYEGPTVTNMGTPVKTFNNDRNSTRNATLHIYEDPAIADLGELYFPVHVESNGNPTNKIILKKNQGYLIEIIPEKKSASIIVTIAWFEADR